MNGLITQIQKTRKQLFAETYNQNIKIREWHNLGVIKHGIH